MSLIRGQGLINLEIKWFWVMMVVSSLGPLLLPRRFRLRLMLSLDCRKELKFRLLRFLIGLLIRIWLFLLLRKSLLLFIYPSFILGPRLLIRIVFILLFFCLVINCLAPLLFASFSRFRRRFFFGWSFFLRRRFFFCRGFFFRRGLLFWLFCWLRLFWLLL